jgi:hypothetical protein
LISELTVWRTAWSCLWASWVFQNTLDSISGHWSHYLHRHRLLSTLLGLCVGVQSGLCVTFWGGAGLLTRESIRESKGGLICHLSVEKDWQWLTSSRLGWKSAGRYRGCWMMKLFELKLGAFLSLSPALAQHRSVHSCASLYLLNHLTQGQPAFYY